MDTVTKPLSQRIPGRFYACLPRITSLAGLIGAAALVSACTIPGGKAVESGGTLPAESGTTSVFNMANEVSAIDRTILLDMASAAAQIYDSRNTTLQINSDDNDPILQNLIRLLVEQGFGVQRVSADQGANYLSYRRTDNNDGAVPEINFSVAIGAVVMGRDYQIPRNNVVAPISRLRLSGTRIPVVVNDEPSARKEIIDTSFSEAQYVASLSLDEQVPVISLITPELVNRVTERSFAGATKGPSLRALNSSKIEVNNLFYGSDSAFSSILDNFRQVTRQIIVFGNDSMVLGDTNKLLLDQFVANELQPDDMISLVGCSNGPTALDMGNEGLALGRAKRVTEALLARGVARDRVLDEGCWAPVSAGDKFPSRGVVLELWRADA